MALRALLSARGIVKVYPNGVRANDGVSIDVYPGEVLGLLGENGAGKTTLVRILAGELRPTSGELYLNGEPVAFKSPLDALRAGVAHVPQDPRLFEGLTVAEDVGLTLKLAGRGRGPREVKAELRRLSEEYGLHVDPDARASELSMGERQRVEILRALALDSRVLLLDEPTTHLTPGESRLLTSLARRLAREGRGVVFITHKLREAMEATDRILVMRAGRVVGELPTSRASEAELLRLMFGGREPGEREPIHAGGAARIPGEAPVEPVLAVEDLWVRGRRGWWAVKGVNLRVLPGEVVGVAGVAGNGQRELFEALVGLARPARGRILVSGRDVTRSPASARLRLGVAVVPEERLGWALVPGASVTFNVALRHAFTNGSFLVDWGGMERLAREALNMFGVNARGPWESVNSLSGGNMQRLILARELLANPRLVIAMNPTAGLDASASATVRSALLETARRGAGVLVFSEDLDELLELSDSILVMSRGRVHGPYSKPFSIDAIASAMTG